MRSARELISAMFDSEAAATARLPSRLFAAWSAIAGPDIAAHSSVSDIRNEVLVVQVDHPGWIQMIRLEEKKIRARINRRYPDIEIRSLRIVTTAERPDNRSQRDGEVPEQRMTRDSPRDTNTVQYKEFLSLIDRLKRIR